MKRGSYDQQEKQISVKYFSKIYFHIRYEVTKSGLTILEIFF